MSRLVTVLSLAVAVAAPATAQTLSSRVASSGDGPVQFHYTARSGVCGNGHSFFRSEENGYYTSFNNGMNEEPCAKGPVRAVIVRSGGTVVKVETYAGPLVADAEGGRDLGAVSARDAASYLMNLAATLDGRPAREAVLPAMLADSAVVTPELLRMATDQSRSRDLRRSAISWVARRRGEAGGVGQAAVDRMLDQLVHDRNENESVRQSALSTISSMDRGEGIPALIRFSADADTWLSRRAFSSLANSGDPRARTFMREALRRTDLTEENRVSAIQGFGNDYATAVDYKVLRDLYPSLNTDRERNALINVVGNAGGGENATWLLNIAKSPTEPLSRRKQAISVLSRSDDPKIKDALKQLVDK